MARLNVESLERRELLTANLLAGAMPDPPQRPILIGVLWPDALVAPAHGLSRTATVDHDETITIGANRITHTWDGDLLTMPRRPSGGALPVSANERISVLWGDGSVRGLNGTGISGTGAFRDFHGRPLTDFGPLTYFGRGQPDSLLGVAFDRD
jgi:hypothetical protein